MQLHIHLRSVRLGILDMLFQFYVFFKIMYNALLSNARHEAHIWSRVRILRMELVSPAKRELDRIDVPCHFGYHIKCKQ